MTARRPKYAPVDEPEVDSVDDPVTDQHVDKESNPEPDTMSNKHGTEPGEDRDAPYSDVPRGEAHDRQTWPVGYSLFAGVVVTFAGGAGVMMMSNPLIYTLLVPIAIFVLWATWAVGQRFNNLIGGANTGHKAPLWAILTAVIGMIAWALGPVIGPVLMSLGNIHFAIWLVIVLGEIAAAFVLILGVTERNNIATIVGLLMFAATVALGTHTATTEAEIQQNQQEHFQQERENQKKLDDTCSSEDAELYPAECSG